MLAAGSPLTQPNSAFDRPVLELLAHQGLYVPTDNLSYEAFTDLLKDHPSSFGLQKSEADFLVQLLDHLKRKSLNPRYKIPQLPTSLFEETALSFAVRATLSPPPVCLIYRSLWDMRVISDLLGAQVKVFTEFNGFLSSRKIGAKSPFRVHLFANSDNQYVLLGKTVSQQVSPSGQQSPPVTVPSCLEHPSLLYDCQCAGNSFDASTALPASAEWTATSPTGALNSKQWIHPNYTQSDYRLWMHTSGGYGHLYQTC